MVCFSRAWIVCKLLPSYLVHEGDIFASARKSYRTFMINSSECYQNLETQSLKAKEDENICLCAKSVPHRSNWVKINSRPGSQWKGRATSSAESDSREQTSCSHKTSLQRSRGNLVPVLQNIKQSNMPLFMCSYSYKFATLNTLWRKWSPVFEASRWFPGQQCWSRRVNKLLSAWG